MITGGRGSACSRIRAQITSRMPSPGIRRKDFGVFETQSKRALKHIKSCIMVFDQISTDPKASGAVTRTAIKRYQDAL